MVERAAQIGGCLMFDLSHNVAVAGFFLVVVAMILSISLAVHRWRQSSQLTEEDEPPELDGSTAMFGEVELQTSGRGVLGRLGGLLRPETGSVEMSNLQRLLFHAGRRGPTAVEEYLTHRVVVIVIALLLSLFAIIFLGSGGFFLAAVLVAGAMLGPELMLKAEATGRQDRIELAVPAALDLLEACMDAGLGLEQALARVAAEMSSSAPDIADELTVLVGEIRAGRALSDAFRKLSDRVSVDEVKSLCSVLIQASSLGAPLAKTLKSYSENARKRRTLFLEEKAGKITASMTLPLTLCLLPSALLIVLGPAVVQILESFSD